MRVPSSRDSVSERSRLAKVLAGSLFAVASMSACKDATPPQPVADPGLVFGEGDQAGKDTEANRQLFINAVNSLGTSMATRSYTLEMDSWFRGLATTRATNEYDLREEKMQLLYKHDQSGKFYLQLTSYQLDCPDGWVCADGSACSMENPYCADGSICSPPPCTWRLMAFPTKKMVYDGQKVQVLHAVVNYDPEVYAYDGTYQCDVITIANLSSASQSLFFSRTVMAEVEIPPCMTALNTEYCRGPLDIQDHGGVWDPDILDDADVLTTRLFFRTSEMEPYQLGHKATIWWDPARVEGGEVRAEVHAAQFDYIWWDEDNGGSGNPRSMEESTHLKLKSRVFETHPASTFVLAARDDCVDQTSVVDQGLLQQGTSTCDDVPRDILDPPPLAGGPVCPLAGGLGGTTGGGTGGGTGIMGPPSDLNAPVRGRR